MSSAPARMTKVAFAGDDFICRREVFDALSAAGGSLPADDLRNEVKPPLTLRVGGEIAVAGGLDAYLDTKFAAFAHDMITINDEVVRLRDGYVLMAPSPHHADGQVPYVAGTQRLIDYASEADAKIISIRTRDGRKAWDCLLPVSDHNESIRSSLETFGWDDSRPVMADKMGTHIDGRARLAEFKKMHPDRKSWDGWSSKTNHVYRHTDMRPVQGLVRSFYENADRCTPEQIDAYKARLADEGIDFDRLVESAAVLTKRVKAVLEVPSLPVVELPTSGLQVSEDGRWVQLRSITLRCDLQPYHAQTLEQRLIQSGRTTMTRQSTLSQGRDNMFGDLDEVIEFLRTPHLRKKMFPVKPALGEEFATRIPALEAARDDLKRVLRKKSA